jgi:hypothetical protein
MHTLEPKHPIGTQFKTRGKHTRLCTVTDILKTYNAAGALVAIRYVATHQFLGQTVTDGDVVQATIDMGLVSQPVATIAK